jgi:hypothetical protein
VVVVDDVDHAAVDAVVAVDVVISSVVMVLAVAVVMVVTLSVPNDACVVDIPIVVAAAVVVVVTIDGAVVADVVVVTVVAVVILVLVLVVVATGVLCPCSFGVHCEYQILPLHSLPETQHVQPDHPVPPHCFHTPLHSAEAAAVLVIIELVVVILAGDSSKIVCISLIASLVVAMVCQSPCVVRFCTNTSPFAK